ncbi:hypothetical protein R4Z09_25570 [Niallia oryzisoli]|uniref:Uncharacterized protein n=1 Tax=Niallia oryzisoli TaxID=1737571 RepID=A0ABZ2CBZ7_9BACI
MPSSLLFVNKLISKYFGPDLLKKVIDYVKEKVSKEKRYENARSKYNSTISSLEYVRWQSKILTKIYGDQPIVHLFGRNHMVVAHPSDGNIEYPFVKDDLHHFSMLKSVEIPEYRPDKTQMKYYNIMSSKIKKPNLIGFELDEYEVNHEGQISSFTANICQYRHTVITSHILEYEMYQLYKENRSIADASVEEILNNLPYRNKIHIGQSVQDVIIKGKNRHALMSVQMMIIYWDERSQCYKVPIIKRSEEVALKPNYWHIIPAGGFEIFEKEDMHNEHVIEENFDIQLALFRELLEELYNGRDFEDNEMGHDGNEIIYRNPVIEQLEKLLADKKAKIEFLGNTTDLTTLRPELSFLLVVDDQDFSKNTFEKNFEGAVIKSVKLDKLESMFKNDLLYPSSAGLLQLAIASSIFKEKGWDLGSVATSDQSLSKERITI